MLHLALQRQTSGSISTHRVLDIRPDIKDKIIVYYVIISLQSIEKHNVISPYKRSIEDY